jgi:programmed cell death protein 5
MNGNENAEAEQLKQIEALKRQLLAKMLTREAFERLARVRMVNPEAAAQVELYLIQLYQTGKIKEEIGDEKIKEILRLLTQKRQVRIKRA